MFSGSFWKKEIRLSVRLAVTAALGMLVLSGLFAGVLVNSVFPYFASIPGLRIVFPQFPVIVNRTEHIVVQQGVNIHAVYERLRTVSVTVLAYPASYATADIAQPQAIGSGLVVTADGYVFTTKSVVGSKGSFVRAVLASGDIYDAEIVAFDPRSELAVLKLGIQNHSVTQFSDAVVAGELLVGVGPALNSSKAPLITVYVSATAAQSKVFPAQVTSDYLATFLQVTPDSASLPPGSGLVNRDGQIVGLATTEGIIDGGYLDEALKRLLANKSLAAAGAGFQYVVVTPPIASILSLPANYGILVSSAPGRPALRLGGPAQISGLREGDFIYKIDGREFGATDAWDRFVEDRAPGDVLELTYYRGGQQASVVLTLSTLQ